MADKLTEAVVSTQELSEEDRELLEEIYTRLDVFEEENRPYHDAAREAREIIRLRDPNQDPPGTSNDKKVLQLHTLKSTINNCVADQMENLPEPRLMPETPAQEEMALDLQDAVHYVLYTLNDYEQLHKRRASDFYEVGTAVTQIAWDPDMANGRGDICVLRWPVDAFLWDPQAENIQDARALMKVSWHPKSWYEEHYPDVAPYINLEDGQYNAVGLPESRQARNSGDEGRAMLIEYWYRKYDAEKRRYTINVAYAAGGALISHDKNVYMHGMYPFVLDVHTDIEGSPVGEGLVKELVPMMRYINRYAHYIDTNLRMSSKGRMLVRKGSGIDPHVIGDWNNDIIEGDRVVQGEDWNWMQHTPFNGMISNQLLQFQSDMKQDSGMNQFSRGETTGGIVSGKAIGYLQEAGGKIVGMRTDTLNSGFKKIVEQILWLMAQFYEDNRMVLITGRNGEERQIPLRAEQFLGRSTRGLPVPLYTVQVEIQRRNPMQVQAQNEMFMQAYTMAAQAQQYFPLSSLFRILNIEGKDRLMPVIKANEEQQNAMQQLQQQNEQMAAQMEQLQKENENLRSTANEMMGTLTQMTATSGNPQRMPMEGPPPGSANAMVDMGRRNLEEIPDE